jgi:hypothetical protein
MEQARVVRLRVIGRLRDEDDRIDLGGRLRTGREETPGGVGAKIQRGLSGSRDQPATQTHGAGGAFQRAGVIALRDADARGVVDAAYPLMGVLCVESWLRQFAGR